MAKVGVLGKEHKTFISFSSFSRSFLAKIIGS
jgi:hypothetical protein